MVSATGQISSRSRGRSWKIGLTFISFFFILTSCAPVSIEYLREAVDHSTQRELFEKLGPPHIAKGDMASGKTVWVYRYHRSMRTERGPKDFKKETASFSRRSECTEYVLTFDEEEILRAWTRRNC